MEKAILAKMDEAARARAIHCQETNAGAKNAPMPDPELVRPPGQVVAPKPLPGLILRSQGQSRIDALRRAQGG